RRRRVGRRSVFSSRFGGDSPPPMLRTRLRTLRLSRGGLPCLERPNRVVNVKGPTYHKFQAKLLLYTATAGITKLRPALRIAQQQVDGIGECSRIRWRHGEACDAVGRDKRDT